MQSAGKRVRTSHDWFWFCFPWALNVESVAKQKRTTWNTLLKTAPLTIPDLQKNWWNGALEPCFRLHVSQLFDTKKPSLYQRPSDRYYARWFSLTAWAWVAFDHIRIVKMTKRGLKHQVVYPPFYHPMYCFYWLPFKLGKRISPHPTPPHPRP